MASIPSAIKHPAISSHADVEWEMPIRRESRRRCGSVGQDASRTVFADATVSTERRAMRPRSAKAGSMQSISRRGAGAAASARGSRPGGVSRRMIQISVDIEEPFTAQSRPIDVGILALRNTSLRLAN